MPKRRFDIYLTEWDAPPKPGRRPCLLLSKAVKTHWQVRSTVVVAPLTTNMSGGNAYRIATQDPLTGRDVLILIDQVKAIDEDRLLKHIGHLDNGSRQSVMKALSQYFDIEPGEHNQVLKPLAFRFELRATVKIDEEREYEFKEITSKRPIDTIKNTADEYAVSFLNSSGGRILWGVNNDHIVVGVAFTKAERDDLRKVVMNKLIKVLPCFDVSRSRLHFHPVYQSDQVIEDLFVVELAVPRGDPRTLYFTESGEAFVRLDGVKHKIKGPEIQEWIEARFTAGDAH